MSILGNLRLKLGVAVASLAFLPALIHRGCAAADGYDDLLLQAVDDCPGSIALVGTGARFARAGLAYAYSDDEGVRGRVRVVGTRTDAVLEYFVERQEGAGPWSLVEGRLLITGGDRALDVLDCPSRASPRYRVFSSDGAAPVAVGASCRVTTRSIRHARFNCATRVECDGRLVYGGPRAGATTCSGPPGAGRAVDPWTSSTDRDPAIEVDDEAGLFELRDDEWSLRGRVVE